MIAGLQTSGERIPIEGVVTDGRGAPVKDVLIENWQANAAGSFHLQRIDQCLRA
jgi:protocatechuate 3,4-dioxygenase, alpha subunit